MSAAPYTFRFNAMAGPCELRFYLDQQAPTAARAAAAEVLRIQDKYSRYRNDSVVAQINANAGAETLTVDEETAALLDFADTAYSHSEGLFDITAGILRQAWDFRTATLPDAATVQKLLSLIGWHRVEWQKPQLRLPQRGMQIDLGGFGKEYAADCAAAILRQFGVRHGLVDLAGDIHVIGPHEDGRAWQIGIQHPRQSDAIAQLPLHGGAIASSGDYQRSFTLAGQRYHHILDPRTGWPSRGLASVSVIAETCIIAGMASTTAMLMGPDKGLRWLDALGLPYFAVDQNMATQHAANSPVSA